MVYDVTISLVDKQTEENGSRGQHKHHRKHHRHHKHGKGLKSHSAENLK